MGAAAGELYGPVRWLIPLAFAYALIAAPLLVFSTGGTAELTESINVATADGTLTNQLVWVALAGLTAYAWLANAERPIHGLRIATVLILAYLGLALCSASWSQVSAISLRRSIQQLMLCFCVLSPFALSVSRRTILDALCWVLAAVVVANVLVMPVAGMTPLGYAGIYGQKNGLGQVAAVCCYFLVYGSLRSGGVQRLLFAVLALASIGLCVISRSKTSEGLLLAAPLVAAIMTGSMRLDSALARGAALCVGLSVVAALAAACWVVPISSASVSNLLFHDTTFTGRTFIWDFAEYYIHHAPWLGYGYGSFWGVGSASSALGEGFISGLLQAHNGYIDAVLELGYVGLSIIVLLAIALIVGLLRLARREPAMAMLLLTCTLFVLMNNSMESSLFRSYVPLWMLLLVCCGTVGFSESGQQP